MRRLHHHSDRRSNPGEFRSWLKARREHLGLSQHRLADAIGMSGQTVWAWENGKWLPDDEAYDLLKRALREE